MQIESVTYKSRSSEHLIFALSVLIWSPSMYNKVADKIIWDTQNGKPKPSHKKSVDR